MRMKRMMIGLLAGIFCAGTLCAKNYTVTSPDQKIVVEVNTKDRLTWQIRSGKEILLAPSAIEMAVKGQKLKLGENPIVKKVIRRSEDRIFKAIVPIKNREVRDRYNEMTLHCKGYYAVTFRVYDNGAAYRFETSFTAPEILVENETVEFNMAEDCKTYWPKEESPEFITHCEADFQSLTLSEIQEKNYAYLPVYLSSPSGIKMVIMDADLFDYPNLFLFGGNGRQLRGKFPEVILESRLKADSDRNEDILKKADYIAKTKGSRNFPWRLLTIDPDDRSLLENNLVWQLSTPSAYENTEWIRPGQISWEWWNALNVYGVDFKAGVNTETYKYFIDFASQYGIEYILLDEGWSVSTQNIKEARPEIDMEELVRYGKEKNVGLILWTLWKPMKEDLEGILDIYRKWGIKGIKIDFMQRSDQDMVNFYEAIAKAAFERELLVDFHGSYKPSGIQRKYPNVMTFEGVYGMEHNKCSKDISPDHDLILPFTRMVAGPMDYTPGATINATKDDFSINWNHPMSQGTRAHQAAIYIAFESPLQMLCDSPSNYYKVPDFTNFITQVPTVWDESRAIAAEAGKYLVMARRSGDKWFVCGLTNWEGRSFEIDLDFLKDGRYKALIFKDGVNANVYASDSKVEHTFFRKGNRVKIDMAQGGGWAAILTPVE